jgi:hypothetical protein
MADTPAAADGLTGQLQALTDSLEEPAGAETGDVVTVEAASVEAAESGHAETPEKSLETPAPEDASHDARADLTAEATAADGAAETPEIETAAAETDVLAADAAETTESDGEQPEALESTESLDDIAPGTTTAGEETGPVLTVAPPITKVSIWPFVGYVVVWLAAAGYAVWRFMQIPAGMALFDTDIYRMSMLGGLVLLAGGPVLLIIVWFASWIGQPRARKGAMFISAFIKGAVATLLGAMIWWGALFLMDYLRLGRLL